MITETQFLEDVYIRIKEIAELKEKKIELISALEKFKDKRFFSRLNLDNLNEIITINSEIGEVDEEILERLESSHEIFEKIKAAIRSADNIPVLFENDGRTLLLKIDNQENLIITDQENRQIF